MSRIEVLDAAIAKRKQYLANLGGLDDYEAIRRFEAERAALDLTEEVPDPPVDDALSADASVAIHQLLAATGHPVQFTASGASIGLDPAAVLADATDEQASELALLGFFGQPGLHADVDYGLFEQYYELEPTGDLDEGGQPTGGAWVPKDPNASAWTTYLASKG